MNRTTVVILAGGLGKRMNSALPKVMHGICGRPMLAYLIDAATAAIGSRPLVVYSLASAVITQAFSGQAYFALSEPKGTGEALRAALPAVSADAADILVTNGDMPLVRPETMTAIISGHRNADATVTIAAVEFENPTGYGRLIKDDRGTVLKIVEEKDATDDERKITSVNAGLYVFDAAWVRDRIHDLEPSPVSGEFYITDLVALANSDGRLVHAVTLPEADELHGINTPEQLARAEEIMRGRI